MGAANALAAYALYAGRIPSTSLAVLVYMALVSKDSDTEPWWSQGHDVLAVQALGAAEPVTDTQLRAVRRAVTPLFETGAVTVARHSFGRGNRSSAVRYRLWLIKPALDENRPVHNHAAPDGFRPAQAASTGRKVVEHRTKSGRAPDENRPPKEYEEYEEREEEQEYTGLVALPVPVRAREAGDGGTEDFEEVRRPWQNALTEWEHGHPATVVTTGAGPR